MLAFTKQLIHSPIGRKLTLSIVLFSSVITLFTTSIQLINDYRGDISRIEELFNNIEKVSLPVLATSLWIIDDELINIQLHGLLQLSDISHLEIKDDSGQKWSQGEYRQQRTIEKRFTLSYGSIEVGRLLVQADLSGVYSRLLNRVIIILLSNAVKTFIVAGFILLLVWYTVTRHLHNLSLYCQKIDIDADFKPLDFCRNEKTADEFSQVTLAINTMQRQLKTSFNQLKKSQTALQTALLDRERLLELETSYKDKLAQQVQERTHELELSLIQLQRAQHVLVEQEKMAALGGLVSGVAHEINTPIGICLTAASSQLAQVETLNALLHSEDATLEEVYVLLEDYQQSCELIINNITRASNLIQKFKSVAAEHNSHQQQTINLRAILEEEIESVKIIFREQEVDVKLDVAADLTITTNTQLLKQAVSNIVSNAFSHAKADNKKLKIKLSVRLDSSALRLVIQDNGPGIDTDIVPHIFEPFYTTTRYKGGTGLGLSAAFNAVTLLEGNIEYRADSELGGACFVIDFPIA